MQRPRHCHPGPRLTLLAAKAVSFAIFMAPPAPTPTPYRVYMCMCVCVCMCDWLEWGVFNSSVGVNVTWTSGHAAAGEYICTRSPTDTTSQEEEEEESTFIRRTDRRRHFGRQSAVTWTVTEVSLDSSAIFKCSSFDTCQCSRLTASQNITEHHREESGLGG